MKVKFIHHSCFTIELEKNFLVFDYFGEGELKIPSNKKIYFIASHRHADHFSPKIFDYKADFYILSDDIEKEDLFPENISWVRPGMRTKIGDLDLAFEDSTDEGVFVRVFVENKGVIFAGDHNWWVWDRYTEENHARMEKWFKGEVDKFKGENIDLIMAPVDPRMKDTYWITGDYYIKTLRPKNFLPMHMWGQLQISQKFKDKLDGKYDFCKIHTIEKEGQEFKI